MPKRKTSRRSRVKKTQFGVPSTSQIGSRRARSDIVRVLRAPTTVGDIVRYLFPSGTHTSVTVSGTRDLRQIAFSTGTIKGEPNWSNAPGHPADVFAIAALLLDLSGATHHICGTKKATWSNRHVQFPAAERERAVAAGRNQWAIRPTRFLVPRNVTKHWNVVWKAQSDLVFVRLAKDERPPSWWFSALFLLVAADEACHGVGFPVNADAPLSNDGTETGFTIRAVFNSFLNRAPLQSAWRIGESEFSETIATISPDIVCVLPKARTPQVGSTLRSLSHHLALLPPRGLARAFWHKPTDGAFIGKRASALNILAIPFPYNISPSSFVPEDQPSNAVADWGWFDYRPANDLHGDDFVEFVQGLVENASRLAGPIHGIVLPESSISFAHYAQLIERVRESFVSKGRLGALEFIVAGTYTNRDGQFGNYAASSIFYRPEPLVLRCIASVQEKHHRWRIDRSQILRYGLGSALSGGRYWWEGIELLSRRLNLFVFRQGAVLAPLICEDLARLEPVHELIRSIGPNLVFALLADGPQVDARWPGRYATGLADDPGSSVLTLTSYGLVRRSNERAELAEHRSDSVGLWRDDRGQTKQITLGRDAAAIVISLSGELIKEHTLDGRSDNNSAIRFHFADQVDVPFPLGSKIAR